MRVSLLAWQFSDMLPYLCDLLARVDHCIIGMPGRGDELPDHFRSQRAGPLLVVRQCER
jgi:hypothetical protein